MGIISSLTGWGRRIDEFFSESRDGSKFRCGICPIRALVALCEDKDGRPFVECARRCRLTEDCRQVYDVGRRSAEGCEWTEEMVRPYPCRNGSPNVREKCMNMWSLRCLKPERVPLLTRPDIFLLKGEEVSASGGCLVLWSQKVCGQIFELEQVWMTNLRDSFPRHGRQWGTSGSIFWPKEFDASIRKNARDCKVLLPARCIMV